MPCTASVTTWRAQRWPAQHRQSRVAWTCTSAQLWTAPEVYLILLIFNNDIHIINERIENVKNIQADLVTARALSDLTELIDFSRNFLNKNGKMLFPKGRKASEEIEFSRKKYDFNIETHKSITDPNSWIVEINNDTLKLQGWIKLN